MRTDVMDKMILVTFIVTNIIIPASFGFYISRGGTRTGILAFIVVFIVFNAIMLVMVLAFNRRVDRLNSISFDIKVHEDDIPDTWNIDTVSNSTWNTTIDHVIDDYKDTLKKLSGPPPAPQLTEEEINSIPQRDDCNMDISGEPCSYPCTYCMWATGKITDEEIKDE